MPYGHKITSSRNHGTKTGGVDKPHGGRGHAHSEDSATDGVGTSPKAGAMKPGGRKLRSKGARPTY